jgi:hypothetical protein
MPLSDEKLVDAFYGLLGLWALAIIKYFYPGVKNFLVKKISKEEENVPSMDPQFAEQLALTLREVVKLNDSK